MKILLSMLISITMYAQIPITSEKFTDGNWFYSLKVMEEFLYDVPNLNNTMSLVFQKKVDLKKFNRQDRIDVLDKKKARFYFLAEIGEKTFVGVTDVLDGPLQAVFGGGLLLTADRLTENTLGDRKLKTISVRVSAGGDEIHVFDADYQQKRFIIRHCQTPSEYDLWQMLTPDERIFGWFDLKASIKEPLPVDLIFMAHTEGDITSEHHLLLERLYALSIFMKREDSGIGQLLAFEYSSGK